jgi:hypothetical protein
MFNPYEIILGFFALAGIVTMISGGVAIVNARRRASWPTVDGKVESFTDAAASPDMQASIILTHQVAEKTYRTEMALATDDTQAMSGTLAVGKTVRLHYDPAQPARVFFPTKQSRSEWLVIVAGAGATIFGVTAILSHP